MKVQKQATITVDLIHKNKEIPNELESDFKEWLIHKGKELGEGWHHEYYAINEDSYHDIHVKILVTINLINK